MACNDTSTIDLLSSSSYRIRTANTRSAADTRCSAPTAACSAPPPACPASSGRSAASRFLHSIPAGIRTFRDEELDVEFRGGLETGVVAERVGEDGIVDGRGGGAEQRVHHRIRFEVGEDRGKQGNDRRVGRPAVNLVHEDVDDRRGGRFVVRAAYSRTVETWKPRR